MTNNLQQILKLLHFTSSDDFYFVQILKRKKEHPELGNNSYVVKTYYIQSKEHLEFYMSEIICLCEFHNARAYIGVNKRSFENVAFHTLKKTTDIILNKDYSSVRKAYNSVCGSYTTGDKLFIIDIDVEDVPLLEDIILTVETKCEPFNGTKTVTLIPTKTGVHLISKPFNISKFKELYPSIDVHKNNPTILYIP